MATHMRTGWRLRTVRLPEHVAAPDHLLANGAVLILMLATLPVGIMLAGWLDRATAPSAAVERAVRENLGQSADTSERLVRTSMTASGDLMVEFVVRDQSGAQGSRGAALADVLAIVRGVYQAPAPRPLNVTLLGVWRPSPTVSSVPLLYASLPADRLVGLDWTRVQPDDLATLGAVRWLPTGVCQAWHDCGPAA